MNKKLFSLISEKEVSLAPGEKIVSAKDFSSLEKASDILKTAKREAIDYRKKVAEECELLKEEGFKKGFDEGLEKLNSLIIKLDKEIQKFEEELKKQILPIALKAAKKILGDELRLHPNRIVDIVIQALKPVTQHHKIKIFANKEDIETLEKEKPKIKKLLEQVKIFSIEERDDIEKGGCIIETEAGIINAQLENQWKALEIAFKKFMKKKE
jgi:type III secretion protein L